MHQPLYCKICASMCPKRLYFMPNLLVECHPWPRYLMRRDQILKLKMPIATQKFHKVNPQSEGSIEKLEKKQRNCSKKHTEICTDFTLLQNYGFNNWLNSSFYIFCLSYNLFLMQFLKFQHLLFNQCLKLNNQNEIVFYLFNQKNKNKLYYFMNAFDVKNGFMVCAKTTSLDHLKKFWVKSLTILNRLQKEWQLTIHDQLFLQNYWTLEKMKALFNCYELIIIQFNEYCEVLELQGLGKCMLKIFIQLMSIVQSLFRSNFNRCQNLSNKDEKDENELKSVRNLVSTGKQFITKKSNKKGIINNQKQYFVQKQRNKFEVRQMQEQLQIFQLKYKQQQSSNDVFTFQDMKIKLARQKALDLEPSNAQFIIAEASAVIENKYNALLNLMEIRNNKIKVQQPKDYKKASQILFEEFQSESAKAYQIAINKLLGIAQKYFNAKELQRKSRLQSQATQTLPQMPNPLPSMSKAEKQKQIKLEEELKNIKNQLKHQKIRSQALDKLLRDKVEHYQKELFKQKATVTKLEQRASIASKFSRRESQFIMDFTQSEFANNKQPSQKTIKFSQKSIQSVVIPRNKSFNYKKQKQVRVRPSYDFGARRISKFGHQELSQKKQKKQRQVKLAYNQNLFQVVMYPSNSIELHQVKDLIIITKSDIAIQTQWKYKQGQKEKKKIQKTVTFMKQLEIQQQFNILIGSQIDSNSKRGKNSFKQYQNFMCLSPSTTLLKKKKGIVSWTKGKFMGTLKDILQQQEAEYYEIKKSLSKIQQSDKQNIQDLFIGRSQSKSLIDRYNLIKDKVKTKILDLSELNFSEEDLNNLFTGSDKARDFEFLNYNIIECKNKFESVQLMKSQKFNRQKSVQRIQKTRGHSQHQPYTAAYENYIQSLKYVQFVIQAVYKHLNAVKQQNMAKYCKLRNFIRFPHSSIYKKEDKHWVELSKEELELGMGELRRIFIRIERIHQNCKKVNGKVCSHILAFLSRMGITIIMES